MSKISVKIDPKAKTLTIVLPIVEKLSKSGKNMVIASTGGNQISEAEWNDQKVTVGVNAYIKVD